MARGPLFLCFVVENFETAELVHRIPLLFGNTLSVELLPSYSLELLAHGWHLDDSVEHLYLLDAVLQVSLESPCDLILHFDLDEHRFDH